jgi:HK97 family phage major capsid protein
MEKDSDFKEHIAEMKTKAAMHPFLKRYCEVGVKEGLFSDSAGALGRMHDTLVEAAYPELIGRNIINVMPTNETSERFPLDEKAVAYRYAEGAVTRLSGKKNSTVDIYTNVLADSSEEWTKEFVEDATWNVMNNMTEKVGRALGQDETEAILALYAAVLAADLATGADLAGGGTVLSWAQLLSLHHAVRKENWRPTVLAINEMQLHQLLNDDKFVHAVYLPSSQTDIEQGSIGSVLGMRVQASTLVPNGTAYAIDTRVASTMLLRRDVNVEDWEDIKNGKYGVRATTRFGIGVLRSTAIARMTNIKQTLT